MSSFYKYIFLVLITVVFMSCSSGQWFVSDEIKEVQAINVFPFVIVGMEGAHETDLYGRYPSSQRDDVAESEASQVLTACLLSVLSEKFSVSRESCEVDYDCFSLEPEVLKRMGGNADAVLLGRVFRYIERNGSDYAISSPASVAFDIRLICPSDGEVLFSFEYNETQQSLLQNLMTLDDFIDRGGRWITAEEMACEAIRTAVERIDGYQGDYK